MRFLNSSGPGVTVDEEFRPHGIVRLDQRDDYREFHDDFVETLVEG
jgi:hypothetical protein